VRGIDDPIRQGQLYLRRAGHLLWGSSLDTTRIDGLDAAARETFFENGARHVAGLATGFEAMGATLESRRVLDFGCGVGRMSLPLAERCEHVYGVDVSPAVLREADRNARLRNLSNVEWLEAGSLDELSGRYDMVVSLFVFQHIPSREGERIISTLVSGLRPGGVGAIQVALRPSRPLARLLPRMRRSGQSAGGRPNGLGAIDWSYPYMLMHSYSLNRLGGLLADARVSNWQVKWAAPGARSREFESATIFFRKD
jgi:SAM-dependent methyltransferase